MPAPPKRKPAFKTVVGEAPDSQHVGPAEKPSFVSLKLAYGSEQISDRGNHKMTYVNAVSEGPGDVMGARVLVNNVMFRARGSTSWVQTRINTRHIMSWTNVPDDPNRRGEKYGPRQISQGDNTVDFITCPAINNQGGIWVDNQGRRAFMLRIDPDHFHAVYPIFSDPGTYKFVMQLSAPNVSSSPRLTLLVEWDGQRATHQIRGRSCAGYCVVDEVILSPKIGRYHPDAARHAGGG